MNEPRGKSTALLAYIPFVGFLIAYSINKENKHPFATWHTKNMFGIFIMFFAALVFMSGTHAVIGDVIWFISFILWIYSFIRACRNQKKGVPVLDKKFQEWFKFLN